MHAFQQFDRAQITSWQFDRLNETLRRCARDSPFYRERLADPDLPDRVDTPGDLARLPFTTKRDLRAGYPFGFLAVPRQELIRYGESTGTTGNPTSSFITYEDWVYGNVWVERALAHSFGPGDLVMVAIPYELTFASYDIDRALEALGTAVVAVGALNQVCPFDRAVQMLHRIRPTALVCTPSRALRFHDTSLRLGLDPLDVGLKTLLTVGETCSPARMGRIARMLGVGVVNAYGSTETNSLALPCPAGRIHLTEDRHFFEVIDPETDEPRPDGTRGELVVTSLISRAMPLIRYRTGDLVVIETSPCPCGERLRVLTHYGRVDDRLEVAGVVVHRMDLEQVLLDHDGVDLYYVADMIEGTLSIRIVLEDGAGAETCGEAERSVRAAFGVDARVTPIARDVVCRAMDRKLKPGVLLFEDLEAVFAAGGRG
jgi:phenylacetate-CoA ligase